MDRMQKIKMTEENFPAPVGFSLANYLRHSFGMFREDLIRVRVRFHKSLTRCLLERRCTRARKIKSSKMALWKLPLKWPVPRRSKPGFWASARSPRFSNQGRWSRRSKTICGRRYVLTANHETACNWGYHPTGLLRDRAGGNQRRKLETARHRGAWLPPQMKSRRKKKI